ncbi:geranylgeranyl transferase type-1 subunit beta [Populus nigra]|uniref:geranylgeranyl transferase type-1 subunit beta n=1 Tax=Populus nigra TaxID=3691 RepID=UPI002B27102C|nr:geranylgeranyl transferase type-1 subunit beta [Populus nigra]
MTTYTAPPPPPPPDWGPSSSSDEESPPSSSLTFDKERHVAFLEMMYHMLPCHHQSQEINHLTLAYFVISGLDILGSLDRVDKDAVAAWVLSLQSNPGDKAELNSGQFYGFCGSRSSQFSSDNDGILIQNHSHLASTYCALSILKTVGYNLSNIDSKLISMSIRNLQQPDGSFLPIHIGAETDLRFIYCAAAICFMLEDWSGMDREKTKEYIFKCQSYDGGFGMIPGSESHGGGTYCAVASLCLMGFIEDDVLSKSAASSIIDIPLLLEWCLQRQAADGGFQGRANKPSDTCYAFWVGAVLRILGGSKLINGTALRGFLLTCQSEYGGFSKFPNELPDLYHSYYGYTALSLLEEPGLNALSVELGITGFAALGI